MRLLLDSVAAVAASTDPAELARSFTERLFETLHARRVGVLERSRQGGFELLGGLERVAGAHAALPRHRAGPRRRGEACRRGQLRGRGRRGAGGLVALRHAPRPARSLPGRHRARGGARSPSPSRARTGSSSTPWPPRWRWRWTGSGSSSASASASARRRSAWRPRSRTCGASCTARGWPTAPPPWSRSSPPPARWRTPTPPSSSPARAGRARRCSPDTVHELSGRRERPMVVVDCSAISPTLIESELFGHERGPSPGPTRASRAGSPRPTASTVFLDEIGELPLDLQSKLLRFVQEKQFTPVGGVAARTVDVRIIAATNVDLRAKVADGPLPRGPLPPPERRAAPRAAAAGAPGGHRPPREHLPEAVRRALPPPRPPLHAARRGGPRGATAGRATCASCRT